MKLIISNIIILCFVFFNLVFSQAQFNEYVKISLVKGVPDKLPERYHKKLNDSFHAEIQSGEFFEGIFLVNKGIDIRPENFFLYRVIKSTGSIHYSKPNFSHERDNIFKSIINIKTEFEDKLSDLTIIFNNNGVLFYKWGENDTVPSITEKYPYKVGTKLPDINLENPKKKLKLSDFQGKILVMNWWATTCTPCVMEIPGLNTLVEKFNNIEFISIVDDEENLDEFLKKHAFKYTHYFGNDDIKRILRDTWPRNIILNKDGTIVHNKTGGGKDTYKVLEKIILSMKQ